MRRRRCGARSIIALLLLLIAVGFSPVYVPVALDSPAFCTGAGDDAEGAWEPDAIRPDLVSTAVDRALTPAPGAQPTLPSRPPDAPPGPPPRGSDRPAPTA